MNSEIVSSELAPKKWRYERKFFISQLDKHQIQSIVSFHPALFREIYKERRVNNIYLDTYFKTNFFKSVDGQSHRIKVRIRWYGALFGKIEKPVLEVKLKNGQLGSKLSYTLNSFEMDDCFNNETIRNAINYSSLPKEILEVTKILDVALINNYVRKYYLSADGNYRVTIDTKMKFIEVNSSENTFRNELNDYINTVLELKYDEPFDEGARFITNHFPFRMTKSSKYVTGLEHLLKTIE